MPPWALCAPCFGLASHRPRPPCLSEEDPPSVPRLAVATVATAKRARDIAGSLIKWFRAPNDQSKAMSRRTCKHALLSSKACASQQQGVRFAARRPLRSKASSPQQGVISTARGVAVLRNGCAVKLSRARQEPTLDEAGGARLVKRCACKHHIDPCQLMSAHATMSGCSSSAGRREWQHLSSGVSEGLRVRA